LINGDFASAESNFRVAKCDYNLALALLMNDKTSEAIETLECADKGAEEYYLMAVAHARNNQQEQAIRSLEKAISIEDTLKERAKTDKEFIDYFEEDDFDRLVN
jgi:tetratricopeptide (TPR) repeat protein